MDRGVLRSWAAEASAFVVLRKRSRSCSSSKARTFAESVDVWRSFGRGPKETAALSVIEAMGITKNARFGEENLLPSERGDCKDRMLAISDCQLKTPPRRTEGKKVALYVPDLQSFRKSRSAQLFR